MADQVGRAARAVRSSYASNRCQCPSETTSTSPSTTQMAVSSSITSAGAAEFRSPCLCVSQCVVGQRLVVEVREDREVDEAERPVVADGRLPPDELLADARCRHHAPGTHADPHRVVELWKEVGQPALSHPVAQVEGVPARHEEHIGCAVRGEPNAPRQCWATRSTRSTPPTSSPVRPSAAGSAQRRTSTRPRPDLRGDGRTSQ